MSLLICDFHIFPGFQQFPLLYSSKNLHFPFLTPFLASCALSLCSCHHGFRMHLIGTGSCTRREMEPAINKKRTMFLRKMHHGFPPELCTICPNIPGTMELNLSSSACFPSHLNKKKRDLLTCCYPASPRLLVQIAFPFNPFIRYHKIKSLLPALFLLATSLVYLWCMSHQAAA